MAKHKIQEYVFLPGVAKSSNAYPNAYSILGNNKEFIIAEAVAYIDQQIALDNASNLYPNAVNLLTNNRTFIIDEIIAWVFNTYVATASSTTTSNGRVTTTINHPFVAGDPISFTSSFGGITSGTTYYVLAVPTTNTLTISTVKNDATTQVPLLDTSGQSVVFRYTYSESSCRRDTGYLVDAIIYDIRYGGNEETIEVAKNFWQGGSAQLLTPGIEIAGFNQIFTIITDFILPKVAYTSQQSPVTSTQSVAGSAAEAGVASSITTNLKPIISNVVSGGLSTLPTISYSLRNFAGYIYDSEKCERDIGYILDAYLNDLRYGGNAQTRYISSRFWNGELPQLSGDRKPEITTQTWIRDLIVNTILPEAPYTVIQNTIPRPTALGILYEASSAPRITTLANSFIAVLTNGLSSLPTLINGVTTIRLLGKFTLDTLLLITNTTKNEVIYNFANPEHPASVTLSTGYVSNDYYQDDDYPAFRNTSDYITTVIIDYNTSTHSLTDDIQIFVEKNEMRVRPYDFGTDAIERHRVALPQSMLDADFEYGLQPTKWQAIGITRGYPSVYEVPGTDTAVTNVVTNASITTGGVGESLITVTTTGPHGFTAGTPITIRALANSITGFARAEGTFLINSVPTVTTFTYYAQAKVGTSNGQVLATTYTQLRKAAFYTGATIGSPAITVYSNGASASFNTKFQTISGSDQIAITGTAPDIGAPLTGTGIAVGAQISSVIGSGGLITTKTVDSNANALATSIILTDATGVLTGMGIDNGSGTSVFVSSIVSNTINLTAPITTAKIGNSHIHYGTSGTNIQPAGVSATFNIDVVSLVYTSVSVNNGGSGYRPTDRILITGDNLGGATPLNDIVVTVVTVGGTGDITSLSFTGTADGPDNTYTSYAGTNVAAVGASATFDITRAGGVYTNVSVNTGGSGYEIGERILISGTSLDGSTPTNDLILEVATTTSGFINTVTLISGTAVSASTIEFYSSVSISEVTTAIIPDNTNITGSAIGKFLATFSAPHGLVPGASILVDISSSGTNHELAKGPSYVEQVPSLTTFRFTARAAGAIDTTNQIVGAIYSRPDSYFIHRPYDGGVQLGTGGPQHGAQAIRMSKKYVRYQSGKGINYCTGALFAPSFSIQSITASGTSIGSFITIVMDDVDHGCQAGGIIEVHGVETKGYNNRYTVSEIVNERTLRVQAVSVLASTTGTLSVNSQLSLVEWHGATVRAGTFDEQNGIYFFYDGQTFGVGLRSSTFQLAGTISIAKDTNLMNGTNTRLRDQVKAGDRVVIRGMTHLVTNVISQTQMSVNPDYRGASDATQAKVCLIKDFIVPQRNFNIDKLDGTGPSGFNIDITKMQMIGMQWSWYAVGFIDFMLRGSDGNFIFFHRIRNSNVNTEAYMRTGNQPVRYEVINESSRDKLLNSVTASQTTLPLVDASTFPNEEGIVLIDNELISFTGKSGNTLTGCSRAAPLQMFVGGALRSFTAGSAATHEFNTGVILVSTTISPIISHWGSAMLTDGSFDEDRGYIFNYAATNVSVSTSKQTAFLIRLAPSVSNAIVGDLGDRELLNRAQLLLKGIEITAESGTGGIVVEGVLNPQNFPTNPGAIQWTGLQGSAVGGQPSFAQIAPGGSVTWQTVASSTTASATTQASPTGTITARGVFSSGRSLVNGQSYIAIREVDYQTYIVTNGLTTGDGVSAVSGLPSNVTISSFANYTVQFGGVTHRYVFLSANANANISGDSSITCTRSFKTSLTSTIFFQKTSWESTGATSGTEVSDVLFAAGTFVSTATLVTFFATQYYRVTFNQTSTSTVINAGTTTVTFKFGQPAYALPGETVFSFIASPGANSHLYLDELKELTNTTLGGRGCYPNGPDVLAINVYKASGTAINANLVIRWGEAQA